jgi:uncharacterized membrane protein
MIMTKKFGIFTVFVLFISTLNYFYFSIGEIILSERNPIHIPYKVFFTISLILFLITLKLLSNKFEDEDIRKKARQLNNYLFILSILMFPFFYALVEKLGFMKTSAFIISITLATFISFWMIDLIKRVKLGKT